MREEERLLREWSERIHRRAKEYGLDFFEVIFEILDFDEINEVAAYDGFPVRYPHWRFGMEYERLRKSYAYGLHRIYEMVINNDPCYAYLLRSNKLVDQKIVMAHVFAHSDFFKNNLWFAHTNSKMLDEMANHATRVRRYIDRYGAEEVEHFLDACLSIEDLIDCYNPPDQRKKEEREEDLPIQVGRFKSKDYMDRYINPPEYLEKERRRLEEEREKHKIPPEPERDILLFLLEYAPLKNWQADILSIIREESYYFVPQKQTKVLNEGWACAKGDTLVYTDQGLLRLDEIVKGRLPVLVSDGKTYRKVYDWAHFSGRKSLRVRTRRGFEIEGTRTHRLLLADGRWCRLGALKVGDRVCLASGLGQWGRDYVPVNWERVPRLTLEEVARQAGVDLSTVIRYRKGSHRTRHPERLEPLLETAILMQNKRFSISIPEHVDEPLATFLGYLTGDGHVSPAKREISLTTGDDEIASRFANLGKTLFGLKPRCRRDGNRWRIILYSMDLIALLNHLGLKMGFSAREKSIPSAILSSPLTVVSAFLRAYFDCDACAGRYGVILSTSSDALARTVQLLLLNFGILSARRKGRDGCWHVHITGASAAKFEREIGFDLSRKQERLRAYLDAHHWYKVESWEDEVMEIFPSQADVYDISVEGSHCYAAHGFINHNSYWHAKMMTEGLLEPDEAIDYADHHSNIMGIQPGHVNPYKLGLALFRDIEERWNKGRFGKEYEECQNIEEKRRWDKQLGLGLQKIFEVRRIYNDVGFIDTFLTKEFCQEQKLFVFAERDMGAERWYEIVSREFEQIKKTLLFSLTNFGRPIIRVVDGNYRNRGELYLAHQHEDADLDLNYARATLVNLHTIWERPVHVETIVKGQKMLLSYDGDVHREKRIKD